ncbi:hypothetical protein GGTG_05442 [Gaeumannomyces tritici R3-111a-1]|uniref:Uncharacterized protein n=1 Tax=Gaeumannomyces tritici (strain R3-111a-1) TaxID=644352 RepID=J3NVY0_GAET3|nr:hypothetical protein GGTG_05442 [Gaeumannomyces tritici R3-111a-1]EJT75509.1 hypothetical protein GGTG_05442 [Gaeumannomyces tritici R3-111a-1]
MLDKDRECRLHHSTHLAARGQQAKGQIPDASLRKPKTRFTALRPVLGGWEWLEGCGACFGKRVCLAEIKKYAYYTTITRSNSFDSRLLGINARNVVVDAVGLLRPAIRATISSPVSLQKAPIREACSDGAMAACSAGRSPALV